VVRASSNSNGGKTTLDVEYSYDDTEPDTSSIIIKDGAGNEARYGFDDSGLGSGVTRTPTLNLANPSSTAGVDSVQVRGDSLSAEGTYDIRIKAEDEKGNGSFIDDNKNWVRIDNTAPSVTDATKPADGIYGSNETLTFTVDYDEAVLVSGTPSINIDIGGTTEQASFDSGSGTQTLSFTYTVESGDADSDGISFASQSIQLNGGAIADSASNDAALDFSTQAPDLSGVQVDGDSPSSLSLDIPTDSTFRRSSSPNDTVTVGYSYNDRQPDVTAIRLVGSTGVEARFDINDSNYGGNDTTKTQVLTLSNPDSSASVAAGETYDLRVTTIDSAGNSTTTTAADRLTVDETQPTVTAITRSSPTSKETNNNLVEFEVSFSELVESISTDDFALNTSISGSITGVSASRGRSVTVTVDNISGEGTLGLDVDSGNDLQDRAENALDATEPSTDETYLIDNTAPTITSATTLDRDGDGQVDAASVVFSEAIDEGTLNPGDYAIGGTAVENIASDVGGNDEIQLRIVQDGGNEVPGTEAKEVTYTQGTTADSAGNKLASISEGDLSETDGASPAITSATTLDRDEDGQVDAADVTFSESIDEGTLSASDYAIGGTTVADLTTGVGDGDDIRLRFVLDSGNEVAGTNAKEVTYTQGTTADSVGNLLADVGIDDLTETDGAAPLVTSATTLDRDEDGRVDAAGVVFSEPIDETTLSASDYAIGGTAVEGIDSAVGNGDDIQLQITQDGGNEVAGTEAKEVTYSQGSTADPAGNLLAGTSDLTETDGAAPVLLRARATSGKTPVNATFSEGVSGSSGSVVSATAGDFTYSDVSGDGASGISSVTHNAGDASATLTLDAGVGPNDVGGDTVDPSNIYDATGNAAIGTATLQDTKSPADPAAVGGETIAANNDTDYSVDAALVDDHEAGTLEVRLEDNEGTTITPSIEVGADTDGTNSQDTVTVSGIDASGLSDGEVTVTARITDYGANTNLSGFTASTTVAKNTDTPGATSLVATAVTDGNIELSWEDVDDGTVEYSLRRSTSDGGPFSELKVVTDTVSNNDSFNYTFTDDGNDQKLSAPSDGTTYHYVVVPIDDAGNEGTTSNEADATADATSPTITSATTFDRDRDGKADSADVVFSEPIDTGTLTASDYAIGGSTVEDIGSGRTAADTVHARITTDANEVAGTDAKEVTYTQGSTADRTGNLLADVNGGDLNEADGARPTITDLEIFDTGPDATVDEIAVTFSETIDTDDSGAPGASDFGTITLPDGATADLSSASFTDPGGSASTVTISSIAGQSTPNTAPGATDISGDLSTNWVDGQGNALVSTLDDEGVTDSAGPVPVTAEAVSGKTPVVVTFSEGIFGNSGSTEPVAAADFAYSDDSNDGAGAVSSVGSHNAGDAAATVQLDAGVGVNDVGSDKIGSSNIFDAAGTAAVGTATLQDTQSPTNPVATSGEAIVPSNETSYSVDVTLIDDHEAGTVEVKLDDGSTTTTSSTGVAADTDGTDSNETVTVSGLDASGLSEGDGNVTITARITDYGSNTNSSGFMASSTVSKDVTSPTITSISDKTIEEEQTTGDLNFDVDDNSTSPGDVVVSATSDNQDLVPDDSLTLDGIGTDRTIRATPKPDSNGTATITVTAEDERGLTASTSFTLEVTPVNDPPTIAEISDQTIQEDGTAGPINFTVEDIETAASGLVVTASSDNQKLLPDDSLSLGGSDTDRTITATPRADSNGTANITVIVEDGSSATDTTVFALTVEPVNDPPTISDINDQTIKEDSSAGPIAFTIGDVEDSASDLSATASSDNPDLVPEDNVTFGGSDSDRTVTVTPRADSNGTATITVAVDDGTDQTTESFVLTVDPVEDAPVIVTNEPLPVRKGAPQEIEPIDLRTEDGESGPSNLAYSVSGANQLENGQLIVEDDTGATSFTQKQINDGDVVYDHTAETTADDDFGFTVTDEAGLSVSGTFEISITTNSRPTAKPDTFVTDEDQPISVTDSTNGVLGNDSDPDRDDLKAFEVSSTSNGNLTLNRDGTFEYVPNDNFNGTDQFVYEVIDDAGTADTADVHLEIRAVNDPPSVANNGLTLDEETSKPITTSELSASDPDNPPSDLTFNVTTAPSQGRLLVDGQEASSFTQQQLENGVVQYEHTAETADDDQFTFDVSDGDGATRMGLTFAVTVQRVNTPPAASDDQYVVGQGRTLTVTNSANGVLGNDSDPDGNSLSASVVDSTVEGTLTLDADGTFEYTPNGSFSGADAFTYEVADGFGGTDQATAEIQVRPARTAVSATRTFPNPEQQESFRLVAAPGAVDRSLASTLSGERENDWRAFRESGSSGSESASREKCGDGTSCRLQSGTGYWLVSKNPWSVSDSIDVVSLEPGSTETGPVYRVSLNQGWNIVSNPVEKDVSWSEVQAANGTNQSLWRWDGSWSQVQTFLSATSGEAYYFMDDQIDELVLPFPGFSSGRRAPSSRKASTVDSTLSLRVVQDGDTVSTAQVGLRSGTETGLDRTDRHGPPGYFETASLRLLEEKDSRQYTLAAEHAPPGREGYTFDLRLRAPSNEVLTLVPEGAKNFRDQQIALIRQPTGRYHDLQADSSVSVVPRSSTTRFRLVMGTEAFVQEKRQEITPDKVKLLPNYPNPFRQATTLEYALPERQNVRVAIYDVMGRRIQQLVNEPQRAGFHQVRWRVQSGGSSVASGVYFVRLKTETATRTERIVVVR